MKISKLFVQARSATVQIADGGLYHTKAVYQLFLNGQAAGAADTAVTSLYDLQPETEYVLSVRLGKSASVILSTTWLIASFIFFHTRTVAQSFILSQVSSSSTHATGARLPSVRRNIIPTVYSSGLLKSEIVLA